MAELADPNPFNAPLTSATVGSTAVFTGLSANTLYYFRVRTQDLTSLTFSVYTNVISTYTLAYAPRVAGHDHRHDVERRFGMAERRQPGGTTFLLGRIAAPTAADLPPRSRRWSISTIRDSTVASGTESAPISEIRALNGGGVPSQPKAIRSWSRPRAFRSHPSGRRDCGWSARPTARPPSR